MSSPSKDKWSQGTLSRKSLYTTLTNENNNNNGNAETDQLILGFQSSTSNRKEKALFEFLERVSIIHHQPLHHSNQKHNRNKGSNHVSASRIENALSRRALTLYGGGIHNSLAPSTTSMVTNDNKNTNDENQNLSSSHLNKKTERKKKRNFQKLSLYNQPVYGSISNRQRKKMMKKKKLESTTTTSNITSKVETSVLFSLNQMWNDYFLQLLNHSGNDCFHRYEKDRKEDTQQQQIVLHNDQISRLVSNAELVGAYVQIDQCKSCLNYTGKNGIVIQITKNTWKIASYNKNNAKSLIHKVWTVPKKGTILTLRVPVNTSATSNEGPFLNGPSAENNSFHENSKVLLVCIEHEGANDI